MRLPTPYAQISRGPRALRFYHGDAVELLGRFPSATVDLMITSPPYNLGVAYRTYDDGRPRAEYLRWTDEWIRAAARALAPEGALFLNVGAKPTDPWTALDVAQAARPHLQLQNLIHWIKSITIEADAAGARAGTRQPLFRRPTRARKRAGGGRARQLPSLDARERRAGQSPRHLRLGKRCSGW